MPIKTNCSCGFSFSAKDELAGRRVKCPRCNQGVQIPTAEAMLATKQPAAVAGNVNKKLLGLLDEEGVKSAPMGPVCPSCGTEMHPASVICIECGFNSATGEHLESTVDDDTGIIDLGQTDAEKIMAKAEDEIADVPVVSDDLDFGDGSDSYVVAIAAAAILGVFVFLGLGVVLIMETVTTDVNPANISFWASLVITTICQLWISAYAFFTNKVTAIFCLLIPPFAVYYAFAIGGKPLFWPGILLLACLPIWAASYAYMRFTTGQLSYLLESGTWGAIFGF